MALDGGSAIVYSESQNGGGSRKHDRNINKHQCEWLLITSPYASN